MITGEDSKTNNTELCKRAAFGLCFAHTLSIFGTAYQGSLGTGYEMILINYSTLLSPAVVVLLSRNVCALVGLCAVPILVIFFGRMYYVWQLYMFGVNSAHMQKGDWAGFLATLVGMLSVAIVTVWLLVRIGILVGILINRLRSNI
jgi:hypothetical protein